MSHRECPRAGHRAVFPLAGVCAVRAGQRPGRYTPPGRAPRAAPVQPGHFRRGCDQGRSGCPGGVGQLEVRTRTGRHPVAVMRVRDIASGRASGSRMARALRTPGRPSRGWGVWSCHPVTIGQASPSRPSPPGTSRSSSRALHLYQTGTARSPEGGRRRRDDPPRPGVRVRTQGNPLETGTRKRSGERHWE
jgi:hypothetical protein